MDQDARPPFGRIRLSDIVAEWSDNQSMNPRLLASELAAVFRSLPDSQVLPESSVSAVLYDPIAGRGGISFGALASYFEQVGWGHTPGPLRTTTGEVQAAAVLVLRSWIGQLTREAEKRAALVAGFAVSANDELAVMFGGGQTISAASPPIRPTGSEPGYLQLHEVRQRQEGEQSAAAQLDAERSLRQQAELESCELRARLEALETQLGRARDDRDQACREMNEERRARQHAEEQLREHAGIIAFMDPNNPFSPENGRLSVNAWCQLTDNGTTDPTSRAGKGVRYLCERLLNEGPRTFSGSILDRITWFINWPARKNGGAVATPDRSKV